MKLYLASFEEHHNHGPGRKIAIADTKPDFYDVDGAFTFLMPKQEITHEYRKMQIANQMKAASFFNKEYKQQLSDFCSDVLKNAGEQNTDPTSLLPFKDGDSLLSWERESFTSYRPVVAEYLKKLGYEVELH